MKNIIIYFLTGGIVTTLIILLEESGLRLWSGFTISMLVFTLFSWVPYMLTVTVLWSIRPLASP